MSYRVKLSNFDGPLDLLLFLIRKNEVDIYDIPIAEITRQYLEYLEIIKFLDLETAGDFIMLAATLIRIKVQMLLPKPELEEDEELIIDPRKELVIKLLEYKRFKEASVKLRELEAVQSEIYSRAYFDYEKDELTPDDASMRDVSLFSLIHAFKQVIDNIPREIVHEIKTLEINTEEQIQFILNFLHQETKVSFIDLIAQFKDRLIMIVTFIALLELVKQGRVLIRQARPFGEIWIIKS